uniref:Uncharacterized protein n=1 Tax=Saccharothrix algeriensis TaxID=173560 RepID=A0A0R5X2H1_9PSEU|nr:hypothetical protein [Saccharothrix algeriensis]
MHHHGQVVRSGRLQGDQPQARRRVGLVGHDGERQGVGSLPGQRLDQPRERTGRRVGRTRADRVHHQHRVGGARSPAPPLGGEQRQVVQAAQAVERGEVGRIRVGGVQPGQHPDVLERRSGRGQQGLGFLDGRFPDSGFLSGGPLSGRLSGRRAVGPRGGSDDDAHAVGQGRAVEQAGFGEQDEAARRHGGQPRPHPAGRGREQPPRHPRHPGRRGDVHLHARLRRGADRRGAPPAHEVGQHRHQRIGARVRAPGPGQGRAAVGRGRRVGRAEPGAQPPQDRQRPVPRGRLAGQHEQERALGRLRAAARRPQHPPVLRGGVAAHRRDHGHVEVAVPEVPLGRAQRDQPRVRAAVEGRVQAAEVVGGGRPGGDDVRHDAGERVLGRGGRQGAHLGAQPVQGGAEAGVRGGVPRQRPVEVAQVAPQRVVHRPAGGPRVPDDDAGRVVEGRQRGPDRAGERRHRAQHHDLRAVHAAQRGGRQRHLPGARQRVVLAEPGGRRLAAAQPGGRVDAAGQVGGPADDHHVLRRPRRADRRPPAGPVLGQHQVRVRAAEPERRDAHPARPVAAGGDAPRGAARRRREPAPDHGRDGVAQVRLRGRLVARQPGQRLAHRDQARRPAGVPDDGLVGRQRHGPAPTGDLPQRRQLRAVARPGAGGVGDHPAEVGRGDPGALVRPPQRQRLPRGVGRVDGLAAAVTGQPDPLDDTEHPVAVGVRAVQPLEHHHARAVREQHAVRRAVEAAHDARAGKPLQLREQHQVARAVGEGAAADGEVGGALPQRLHAQVDGVERGGAGGVDHDHLGVGGQQTRDGVAAHPVRQELVRWLPEPVVAGAQQVRGVGGQPVGQPVEVAGQHQVALQVLAAVGGVAERGEAAPAGVPAHPVQRRVQAVAQPERGGLAAERRVLGQLRRQARVGPEAGDEAGFRGVGAVLGLGIGGVEGLDVEQDGAAEHVPALGQDPPQLLGVVRAGGHHADTDHRHLHGVGAHHGGGRRWFRGGRRRRERGPRSRDRWGRGRRCRSRRGRVGKRRGRWSRGGRRRACRGGGWVRGWRGRGEQGRRGVRPVRGGQHRGAQGQPAVGDHRLAGDPRRGGRGQEHHQLGQLLLPPQPAPQRGRRAHPLGQPRGVGEQAGHRAVEQAAGRGVDPDAGGGELHGQVAGQRLDRRLRGAHGGVVADHQGAADRGQVDDRASPAPRHQRRRPPGAPQAAAQVGVHGPLPVRLVQPVQRQQRARGRVVHQHVDRAAPAFHLVEQGVDLLGHRDRGAHRPHRRAAAGQLGDDPGRLGRGVEVVEHHLRAAPRERLGDRPPHTARAPGHHDHATRELPRHRAVPAPVT